MGAGKQEHEGGFAGTAPWEAENVSGQAVIQQPSRVNRRDVFGFQPLDNRGQVAATFPGMPETLPNDESPQPSWKVCAGVIWLCAFAFV